MYNTPKGTIGTHSIVSITEQSDATTSPLSRATGGGGALSWWEHFKRGGRVLFWLANVSTTTSTTTVALLSLVTECMRRKKQSMSIPYCTASYIHEAELLSLCALQQQHCTILPRMYILIYIVHWSSINTYNYENIYTLLTDIKFEHTYNYDCTYMHYKY